ncbi:MAG: hypothetical protein UU38_C0008G0003 [Candidatus Wolfebacteria bacterium GW2011_GWB1_41_12]|uniref:Ferric oxidoreductase domain-containing protein n=1 Tax=Candidatus Wolfebacteria bacterium GW2011_GWB1_41_12 TaxID=1619006 RepID=A0A0G0UHS1_9BACT|nr:MAG: hypothetical protein UU38_C0008G0003 [Candidatus Wolfebacteria bacterium GW2011_GWB1_41_12]
MNKLLFYIPWLLVISVGPVTLLRNAPPVSSLSANQIILINFLQRGAGLLAFSLLFSQIMLGAYMHKLIDKFGAWVFKFHTTEGAFTYSLIFLHPLLFLFLNFKSLGKFDPFYVFTDVCVLCRNTTELFYNFGRVSFWLITVALLAALLRTQPWLRNHWRKFHIFNYFAFLLIAVHSRGVGTDVRFVPFVWFYWISITIVVFTIFYKFLYPRVSKLFLSNQKPEEAK